ncbi:carboxylesterase family protein [Streptomyces sp. NPDC094049]|uniref:carboxylesterase/lipase family protein n=1 Tax=Streptomyces sp. NPDC094049 TaxID=3154987 RepID=UPI003333B3AF
MTDGLLADTTCGPVRGRALADGTRLFAGIPFAAPPVGELRFQPPEPPRPWRRVRPAEEFGAAPAQGVSVLTPADGGRSTFPSFPTASITRTSEDCLHLNVWAPAAATPGTPRPVIVWIYGGGFEAGSAAPPYSDGHALSRLTGAVVVSANYRLGAFGFLHLADFGGRWARATNAAQQDQIAALRWVRDNIAAFGGDPGAVTVAGQSAGAFSIGALLGCPAAAGLFHRAVLLSGSTARITDRASAATVAGDLLDALRITDPDELVKVSARRILDAQGSVVSGDIGTRNLPGGRAWATVLDGDVVPRAPQEAVESGAVAHIPLLVGATRDEVRVFQLLAGDAYRPADEEALHAEMRRIGTADPAALLDAYRRRTGATDLADLRTAFLSDAVYRVPATRLAGAQTAAGGRAYHFLLCEEPCGPGMGAFHGSDLLYVFDKLAEVDAATPGHLAVRDRLAAALGSFIETGDPGWPPYEAGAPDTSRTLGGSSGAYFRSASEPPADDVTALWPSP